MTRRSRALVPALFAWAALAACDPPQPAARRNAADPAPQPARPEPAAPVAVAGPPGQLLGRTAPPAPSGEGWNPAQIDWQPYAAGLARARAERKPVCLVFHAGWCPHCRTYSHVFDDPRVVARAREMIMVRVNVDEAPEIASRYELDGTYVPRTYFLAPDGTTLADIDAHRPRFRYFFDEHNPSSVLAGMEAALARR